MGLDSELLESTLLDLIDTILELVPDTLYVMVVLKGILIVLIANLFVI